MVPELEFVDLRRVTGRELDPLLLEETVEWEQELDWDFGHSAEAIRGCVDVRELTGCALLAQGEVVGYGYAAVENRKGMVGDLFVRPPWRNGINDVALLRMLLAGLVETPGIDRVESQMMLAERSVSREAAAGLELEVFDRSMMSAELTASCAEFSGRASLWNHGRYRIEAWSEAHFEGAAGVITLAYDGHIDSRINDQYRGMPGARTFLRNIVRFPSLGMFFGQGSFVAVDAETGRLCGMVLVSLVGPRTGHVTQLCIVPGARQAGLGRRLLDAALGALREAGIPRASLTVTDSNTAARELYRQAGFRVKREFSALAGG